MVPAMAGDTHPEAMARYAERLRALGPAERLAIAAGLTQGVRALAEAGLRRRHPRAGADELRWRLAALLYGRAAADRLHGPLRSDAG
jgi:hypothetical protein